VPYHDSLWVAVTAAAPVIALAAIVSLSDTSGVAAGLVDAAGRYADENNHGELAHTGFMQVYRDRVAGIEDRGLQIAVGGWITALINLALQVALVAIALISLADGSNAVSPIVPEIAVPLGVFLLLGTALLSLWLRELSRTVLKLEVPKRDDGGSAKPTP
jgi:hypothetical protein